MDAVWEGQSELRLCKGHVDRDKWRRKNAFVNPKGEGGMVYALCPMWRNAMMRGSSNVLR